MARHRNFRKLNYDEECDFDDVYGRSVEEELCISPNTAAEFLYDRGSKSTNMSAYFSHEENIPEEVQKPTEKLQKEKFERQLNDIDKARLNSCIDEIRSVIGELIPEKEMVEIIIKNDFDINKSVDAVLVNHSQNSQKEEPKPQRQRKERRRNADDFSNSDDENDNDISCSILSEDEEEEEELNYLLQMGTAINSHTSSALEEKPNSEDSQQDDKVDCQDEFLSGFNLSKFLPKPAPATKKQTHTMLKNKMQDKRQQNCIKNNEHIKERPKLGLPTNRGPSLNLPEGLIHEPFNTGAPLPESRKQNMHGFKLDRNPISKIQNQTNKSTPLHSISNFRNPSSFEFKNPTVALSSQSKDSPLTKNIIPPPFSLEEMLKAPAGPSLNDLAIKHMSAASMEDAFSKSPVSSLGKPSLSVGRDMKRDSNNKSQNISSNVQKIEEKNSQQTQITIDNKLIISDRKEANLADRFSDSNTPSLSDLANKHLSSKHTCESGQVNSDGSKENKENISKHLQKVIGTLEDGSSDGSESDDVDCGSFDLNSALKPPSVLNEHKSVLKTFQDNDQFSPISSHASDDSGYSSSSHVMFELVQNPVQSAKRSLFGSVLCLRLKPPKSTITIPNSPYFSVFGSGSIRPFDFVNLSPDDIVFSYCNSKR